MKLHSVYQAFSTAHLAAQSLARNLSQQVMVTRYNKGFAIWFKGEQS